MSAEELKLYTKWLAKWMALLYFFVVIVGKFPIGRDDTDQGEWGGRGGMALRTDSMTGCQYLEASGGGLTPRISASGKHFGCKSSTQSKEPA